MEQVATKTLKCIRPDQGNNWARAKQTWEVFSAANDVVYFIAHPDHQLDPIGYIRLLRVSGFTTGSTHGAYVTDFTTPSNYLLPRLAADQLAAPIFCKAFSNDHEPWASRWPKMRLGFPKLDMYPYHNQQSPEAEWLLVLT